MSVWTEAAADYIRRDLADCRPTVVAVLGQECPDCGGAVYSVDGEGATCGVCAAADNGEMEERR